MATNSLVICGFVPDLAKEAEQKGIPFTYFDDAAKAKTEIPRLDNPAVFIMSVTMPNGSAYDLAPLVRQCYPGAKIWLMSFRADDMREEIERDPNFDRMVFWPSTFGELLDEVIASD